MRLNIEDMKKIAKAAITVADEIATEARSLGVFCHRVIDAVESAEDDFKIITLDGEKAKATYLTLKAKIIGLAESIPISVPEGEPEA